MVLTTHRRIFLSSAITGGATLIQVAANIVKIKVLAVLLGPTGIGLLGLFQNIMGTATTLSGCGMSISGVRQIATASGDNANLAIVRRALWYANLILGLFGMTVLWLLRESVAQLVFGSIAHADKIGWLGLGVLLTLISGSQTALLQGLRRIGDLAWVTILSAIAGAVVGILAVYLLGEKGVLWFVLTAPATSIFVAIYFTARLPRPQIRYEWGAIQQQWRAMFKLGFPLMAAGLVTMATQVAVRSIILRDLGLDATGYFQAAWAISMTYIGFVLGAMSTDYFPRLTEAIKDHKLARDLVNEQAEMALLLAGPVLLAMITLAPWVIHLLYAESFRPATEILRWQVMGDILKVATWPIGFIVLAMRRGGVFFITEFMLNAIYLGAIFMGIQGWGLIITGISFWFAYLVHYGIIVAVARQLISFKPVRRNWLFTLLLLLASALIIFFAGHSSTAGYTTGLLATVVCSIYSLRRLDNLVNLRGWFSRR